MNLTLARRNIWRQPRRSILTASAIVLATSVLVFFSGLQFRVYDLAIGITVNMFTGNLQIQREGYNKKPQVEKAFSLETKLLDSIKSLPAVSGVTKRASGFALASSEKRSIGVQVLGIEAKQEPRISSLTNRLASGRYLRDTTDEVEALIGTSLAKNLRIDMGASQPEITILGQGYDGSVAASVVKVVGIFDSGDQNFDRNLMLISLPKFQDIFFMGDRIHSLVIKTKHIGKEYEAKAELNKILNKAGKTTLIALTWDEILPGIKQSIKLDLAASWLFYLTLILVVTLSIVNTFLMSVLERTREFGVILALGLRSSVLSRLVLFEGALLSAIGIALGTLLGCSFILYFGKVGFNIPGGAEIMKHWNLPAVIYPEVTPLVIFLSPSVVLVSALLGLIYPALKVSIIKPLEALRST